MYYSKNSPQRHTERLIVPENYSGNAFRVKDETDRRETRSPYTAPAPDLTEPVEVAALQEEKAETDTPTDSSKRIENERPSFLSGLLPKNSGDGALSSLLRDINIEDILLFALVFLMYQDDPDDDILLLLIILIFLK